MAPFPRSVNLCSRYTLSELRFVEADIGFLAGTPTIIRLEISITRAKQACESPAAYTVVLSVILLPSGVHQRMLDGLSLVSIREYDSFS